MSITLWNTPIPDNADLRDASRLIRSARQGVLFLVNAKRVADALISDILGLQEDKDLLIEGILWSGGGGRRGRFQYEDQVIKQRRFLSLSFAGPEIDSTIVLVDPFGPHPVVITGSHDLSAESSAKDDSDLLIIENAPGLAAEYAVHLIGLFDHYRWQYFAATRSRASFIGLSSTDAWQRRFFKGTKRSEFNFLFGSLSPGL